MGNKQAKQLAGTPAPKSSASSPLTSTQSDKVKEVPSSALQTTGAITTETLSTTPSVTPAQSTEDFPLKEMKPAQTHIAEKILKERCTQGVAKLTVSPAVQKYAERLKALYSKRTMPDYLKGRQLPTSKFVSLALISREGVSQKDMDEFTRTTVQDGDIDVILKKKVPLELRHIGKLENGSLVTRMLLQGGPGTGKTTFAWNLCREWESGELFQEYSLVVFIPLRRKEIKEAKDIRELFSFGNPNNESKDNICKELLNSQGESVLLVLDGYDELPEDVQKDSLISKVVDGEYLPKASVLVTSRPSACGELYDKCHQRDENFQHIEVLGFTQDKIKVYIEDNVDSKQLPQFIQYLSSHPNVMTMMYNPLQCALTVEVCKKLFEDGSYLPKIRTKLYETNVLMTMSREHPTLIGRRTNNLQELPKALHEKFVKLCRLAYDGIVNHQIIFEDVPEEIKEIGLLVSEPELDSVLPSSENYNFFHLSIQEFCAAYYISSLPERKQTTLMSRHSSEGYFREVIIFVCGMSSNPEKTMDIAYSCISSEEDTLFLLHCAFESQCGDTCSSLVKKWNSSIDLSYSRYSLTPSDMSAVGFVICKSKHPTKELNLYSCYCDDDGLRALINQFHLTLEEHSSLAIEEINLYRNNIGDDGAKCLSEGLKYCPKLQTLVLFNNEIGDDGAKCLSEGLKYCPKLQTLYLSYNNIGADGAKCLSEGLKYCPELQTLDLSRNNIGDDGAKCLSEGLKYCPELQTLDLNNNNISDDGAKCLSEGLKYCPKLQRLYLYGNNIGADGAKCLSEGLKYCLKLQILNVEGNSLSDEGEAVLEKMEVEVNSKRGPHEDRLNVFKSKAERTVQEVTERRAIEAEEKVKTQLQETDRKQSSALDLPGVQFIFEGKLTIKRSDQLQTLSWKNHGLKIHVPPGALPDSEDTCDIDVATSFSENFILPPNYMLVSAIYYIQPSMDLLKPVTLEIEHCCSVKNESNTTILTPIFAQCSHRSPPYTFQLLESSSNEIKSFVGRFEVSTFSFWGFVKRIITGMLQTEQFYCGRVYCQNQSNGWFFVSIAAIPRLPDFLLMVEKKYSRHWHLMTKFEFSFSENSDVLQILVNESGIATDNGWVIKPYVVPFEIEKKNIDFREFPEPASCEMSVKWSKKDEDPQDLEHWIEMKGISREKLLITLSPQSGTAVAGIKTDSFVGWGQTSVPVKVVDKRDWAAICGYLRKLDRSQIQLLGGELGLSVFKLQHMQTLPGEMVTAWLRREDDVKVKSGDRLSWNVLSKALDKIGHHGIADDIRSKHCN